MVAVNRVYPDFDPAGAICEDTLAEVAYLRAHGKSWEETAKAIEWDAVELRQVLRHDPNFPAMLELAQREAEDEADADGLARLRVLAHSPHEDVALHALQIITKYLADKRRDETRLAVEQMRAQTKLASIQQRAAKTKQKEEEEEEEEDPELTPAQVAQFEKASREYQAKMVDAVTANGIVVYLWAGDQKLINRPPGPQDKPLQILRSHDALCGGNPVYWAVPFPCPTDIIHGPFIKIPDAPTAT